MNITYDIIETTKDNSSDFNNSELSDNTADSVDSANATNLLYNQDEILALATNYSLNYSLSYLNSILEFYNIKKKKNMKKQDIINRIVEFETNLNNKTIVSKRIRLFSNFIELKNNEFFNKFIIGSL